MSEICKQKNVNQALITYLIINKIKVNIENRNKLIKKDKKVGISLRASQSKQRQFESI
jgi:hypothetical protein